MRNVDFTIQIDRDDIRALRKAHSVVFRTVRGTSQVEATLGPHVIDSPRYEFKVAGHRLDDFHDKGRREIESAYMSVCACQVNEEWQTVAALLRSGDTLILHWLVGNDSQTMRDRGITRNELRLVVQRETRGGKIKRLAFPVSDVITTTDPMGTRVGGIELKEVA